MDILGSRKMLMENFLLRLNPRKLAMRRKSFKFQKVSIPCLMRVMPLIPTRFSFVECALGPGRLMFLAKTRLNVSLAAKWAMWPDTVAKWEKVMVPKVPNHIPKSPVNKSSTMLQTIWVAKEAHAGGAFGSNPSILDTLIDASKDPGEGLVSTVLGLSHQNERTQCSLFHWVFITMKFNAGKQWHA
jgi:hypothetical protein